MPDAKVHLYGKGERAGRKLGHVNIVGRAGEDVKGLTPIGVLLAGEGVEVRRPDGALLDAAGFDQLT